MKETEEKEKIENKAKLEKAGAVIGQTKKSIPVKKAPAVKKSAPKKAKVKVEAPEEGWKTEDG